MPFTESQLRRLYPTLLLVLGLVLFFPALSSFGLWDPYEIRLADAARQLATAEHWTWAPQLGRPPLLVWLIALGFKVLKINELGGRLPVATVSLGALLAVYWAGVRLVGRRGALFGAVAMATTPQFLLGARQLTSDAPLILGAALAVGGLARAAWPEPDDKPSSRVLALVAAAAGLVIGQLSAGLLVGVLAPIAAVTLALALAGGLAGYTVVGAVITIGLLARAVWEFRHPVGYSAVLGGAPHVLSTQTVVTQHLKQIGFGLFPWVALAPVAAIHFFDERPPSSSGAPVRDRFGGILLLCWFSILYLAGTISAAGVQDLHIPVAPALMLLAGSYLDELLDDTRPLPFAGVAVALATVILGRDFFLFPEQYVGVHMIEPVRWPGPLTNVPYVIMAFAAFFGGVLGLGLGAPLAAGDRGEATGPPAEGRGGLQRQKGRRLLFGAAAASALLMMLATEWWIVPQVSKHLSAREIYGKTRTLDPTAPVGQYRFNASGASYYAGNTAPTTLAQIQDVFSFLARPERVFVMAGSEELPAIDQKARETHATYFVIDDSNSRYLVLSNRLGPTEKDLNPLRLFISEAEPTPSHKIDVNFENKVQLLGYDLPDQLDRGQDFKIRLYFKVLAPVGGAYKVFLHFDGPGTRFNGDHVPMEGRFPTQHWVPGYFVIDEHAMAPDRATQPSGFYRIFMGFFAGDSRLKVVSGPQDGENRVKLGAVTIR